MISIKVNKMVKRLVVGLTAAGVVVGLNVGIASAHVVVKPAEVGVGAFQTFTTGVPNEKDGVAVSKIRLAIPEGLNHVSPNVKPGWTIDIAKTGEGEDAKVTEITWSGGSIPAGQRDDFVFSAQAPAKPTSVQWKAYQTYDDGTEVSWDQTPTKQESESEDKGPYSVTKVVDDVSEPAAAAATTAKPASDGRTNVAIALSVVALLFSFLAYTTSKAKTAKK